MARVRVHNFAMSVDGYAAGPDQSELHPLGVGGTRLHEWVFASPRDAVDDEFVAWGDEGIGATVMGRNMFGPVRGDWGDGSWTGWWGPDPPYHHPVFVLTHHAREPLEMEGGTTFHFVTDGPDAAIDRALEAAGGLDVRVGGGVATVRQYLRSGDIDELHVPVVPVLLGAGERLFDGLADVMDDYECTTVQAGDVAHLVFAKR